MTRSDAVEGMTIRRSSVNEQAHGHVMSTPHVKGYPSLYVPTCSCGWKAEAVFGFDVALVLLDRHRAEADSERGSNGTS